MKLIFLSLVLTAFTANAQVNTEAEAQALFKALAGTWEVFGGDSLTGEMKRYGETTRRIQDGVLFETRSDSYEKGIYEFNKEGGYIRLVSIRRHLRPAQVSTVVFKCFWDVDSKTLHIHYPESEGDGEGFRAVPTFSLVISEKSVEVLDGAGKPNGTTWKRKQPNSGSQ